jgi:hypothetical protein
MKSNQCRTILVTVMMFTILLSLGTIADAQPQQSKCQSAFSEYTNKAQAQFLKDINPHLASQKKVVEVATRANGKTVADPLLAIQKYIDYLNSVYPRVSRNDQKRAQITTALVEPHIIKELPAKYIELQKQIARERGHGDVNLTKKEIDELLRHIQQTQENSLGLWVDYLLSSDSSMYPVWTKVWILNGVVKLGKFDKEKGNFAKRTEETVAPFPDLNREALAKVVGWVVKVLNKKTLDEIEDPELIQIIKSKAQFGHWYVHAIKQIPSQHFDKTITSGQWIKYLKGSDPKPLVESLYNRATGWCTAEIPTAKKQLMLGDFYVYYSNNATGAPVHPRIAIRMEDSTIAEIRGVEQGQNFDNEIAKTHILNEKLKDFGNEGGIYLKKDADMKMLTAIEKKHKSEKPLNQQELEFLYELHGPIVGFGYSRDPRLDSIIQERLPKNPDDIEFVLNNFRSPTAGNSIHFPAIRAIAKLKSEDPRVLEVLLAATKKNHKFVRQIAVEAIAKIKSEDPRVLEVFLDATKDSYELVRKAAIEAIAKIKSEDPRVLEVLLAATKDSDKSVRGVAIRAIEQRKITRP